MGPLTVSVNPPSPNNLSTSTKAPDIQKNPRPRTDRLPSWDPLLKLVQDLMSGCVVLSGGKRETYVWYREKSSIAPNVSSYSKPSLATPRNKLKYQRTI